MVRGLFGFDPIRECECEYEWSSTKGKGRQRGAGSKFRTSPLHRTGQTKMSGLRTRRTEDRQKGDEIYRVKRCDLKMGGEDGEGGGGGEERGQGTEKKIRAQTKDTRGTYVGLRMGERHTARCTKKKDTCGRGSSSSTM